MPPIETFPGHQLTWARIMWVLIRMKPQVTSSATRKRKAGSRPVSTISRSNSLLTLAIVVSMPAGYRRERRPPEAQLGVSTTLPTFRRSPM